MPVRSLRQLKLDKYGVDSDTRENFESIEEYITDEIMGKANWEFAEIEINGTFTAGSPYKFKHNSSFIPQDIIITSTTKATGESSVGTVAVIYDDIDKDYIYFTCTNPGAKVRFFFGTFKEVKR
jgi:hypothetical protein